MSCAKLTRIGRGNLNHNIGIGRNRDGVTIERIRRELALVVGLVKLVHAKNSHLVSVQMHGVRHSASRTRFITAQKDTNDIPILNRESIHSSSHTTETFRIIWEQLPCVVRIRCSDRRAFGIDLLTLFRAQTQSWIGRIYERDRVVSLPIILAYWVKVRIPPIL